MYTRVLSEEGAAVGGGVRRARAAHARVQTYMYMLFGRSIISGRGDIATGALAVA